MKQSEELAIASAHNVFFRARIKLTGIYILILGIVLFGFSVVLYQSLSRNLMDATEENFSGVESHHQFVESTLADVQKEILVIDFVILVVAAGASYIFAGYTLRPVQRSLSAQKQFSENASHELRTPLAVMKSDIEVLMRNPYPTKEIIHGTLLSNIEEINRMTKMTEDLLAIARSENHDVLGSEKMDIVTIIQKTAEKIQPIAAKKGVKIVVRSSSQLFVHANKEGIGRVLMNLLQNSIQHTPSGGTISINAEQEGSQVVVRVSDTGSGISEKDIPHIFERFYKGEGSQGSGLGLSMVKEIVEQYGGSISITSEKDKGTMSTIELPAAF